MHDAWMPSIEIVECDACHVTLPAHHAALTPDEVESYRYHLLELVTTRRQSGHNILRFQQSGSVCSFARFAACFLLCIWLQRFTAVCYIATCEYTKCEEATCALGPTIRVRSFIHAGHRHGSAPKHAHLLIVRHHGS